jgi:putative FmdB family regulatory protein
MPVYEFVCLACEEHFDRLLPMAADEPSCPRCGATRTRRQLSVIAGLAPSRDGSVSASASSGCACGGACACGR